ncbi:PREDICTED: uncharacterized protein LOC104801157 [Tarenaya hassleriana]|uniref:uncharacterized protein LOC104801157 n=1 Tax=Tarenaya hassleriana TaxID=28532 RepID=UPI00053C0F09|nr:PREDICTED: uncharacterized protein LOC104801157 [Tarenaya hassleriana]XP_010522585.1 PREDICTED: uncharacterized protein LOC104801157 [Tarenaya hassleriana]XP_010522587.1 PREDICTED: uncharacterized protein LOC104801157 [Tarenaya hassleriana]
MDAKALAKSKRAHSLHHSKKSHSGHKPKVQPESSENVRNLKKQQGNQAAAENAKNPVQSRRQPALPSNWDRYDEDLDLDMDSTSGNLSVDQTIDAIIPKSKGADYRHLIAEAEAESQSKINIVSDSLCSLDDVLHDEFSRLVGSMLSAKGEGILSWIEDDNFIVEDGSASSHEPAFLSLNLNALAEKLEKVELHEALYVEADIFLTEPLNGDQGQRQSQTIQEAQAASMVQPDFSGKEKLEWLEPIVPRSDLEYDTDSQVKDIPIITGRTEKPSNTLEDVKSPAFEAELDMLLDSFAENGVQESHNKPRPVRNSTFHTGSSDNASEKSSAFQWTSAESELDTLLNASPASGLQESDDKPNPVRDLTKETNPSDKMLQAARFDEVLDDLLGQTSDTLKPQQNQTASSSSVGRSKVLDEFDSWLDTI